MSHCQQSDHSCNKWNRNWKSQCQILQNKRDQVASYVDEWRKKLTWRHCIAFSPNIHWNELLVSSQLIIYLKCQLADFFSISWMKRNPKICHVSFKALFVELQVAQIIVWNNEFSIELFNCTAWYLFICSNNFFHGHKNRYFTSVEKQRATSVYQSQVKWKRTIRW